jgi:hypothetical protein
VQVFADETRPVLQGARLTAWELHRDGIPVTLLPDVAAASLLARGLVDLVIVGADRIAANGDVGSVGSLRRQSMRCIGVRLSDGERHTASTAVNDAPQRLMSVLPAVWHAVHLPLSPLRRATDVFARSRSDIPTVAFSVAEAERSSLAWLPQPRAAANASADVERMRRRPYERMLPPGAAALALQSWRSMPPLHFALLGI